MDSILVDHDGYNQFMKIFNSLENKIQDISNDGTEACDNDPGNGWHDNFSFEAIVENSRQLQYQLNQMKKDKTKLRIIDEKNVDKVIHINDVITIKFIYDDNDYDIDNIKLTGKYIPNNNETTLNSPLGKTIYNRKINDKLEYKVNDKIIKIEILDIKKQL